MFSKSTILNVSFVLLIVLATCFCVIDFEMYGNVFRFLPILCFIPLILKRQFILIKHFAIALIVALIVAYMSKMLIFYLALHFDVLQDVFAFARRPINLEFKGFPSGHATSAFSGVAFAYFYYDTKWNILFLILAVLVGFSRIFSFWHTPLQVFVGSLIGFFVTFAVLKYFQKQV